MSTAACDLPGAARAAMLTAALLAAVGCGSLDRSVLRDHCSTRSDCNPGRVCVAGTCQAPTDGGMSDRVSDVRTDAVTVADVADAPALKEAGAETADTSNDASIDGPRDAVTIVDVADAPAPKEAAVEITKTSTDAGVDAPPDAPYVNDAGADSADARTDIAARNDVVYRDVHPDPCTTGPEQQSPAAMSSLLTALPGVWRLCPLGGPIDPDVGWLLGSTGLIQLDARQWWRCSDGQPPTCAVAAQGRYFRVLEGPNSVFHFADGVDPLNGGGADISIHYFAAAQLLQVVSCDGATHCSSNVVYLSPVASQPGG